MIVSVSVLSVVRTTELKKWRFMGIFMRQAEYVDIKNEPIFHDWWPFFPNYLTNDKIISKYLNDND